MAFIPTPNGIKAHILMQLASRDIGNDFWAFTSDPTDPTQRVAFGNNLLTWMQARIIPFLSDQILLEGVEVTDQTSASGGQSVIILTTGVPGAVSTASVTSNSAFVTTLQTASRGRSFRGRSFLAGLPEADLATPNLWANSLVVAMQSAYAALLPAVNVGGQFLAVASHRAGGAPRTSGVLTQVIAVRANDRVGSQRRRTGR